MEIVLAMKIAKNKKTTPAQLKEIFGISDELNRVLAKHPNLTPELLDELGMSLDDKTVALVTEHPNISIELLNSLGAFHPLAMFRNPALPGIMEKSKNYIGEFYGEEFEAALKSKKVPDFIVDWLAAKGNFEQQAIYMFGTMRAPEVLSKFRNSKHAKIVAQLLQRDDDTYLAWAHDLGFEMPPPFEDEPVIVRSEVDDWVERLDNKNSDLWKELVPETGEANTVQGELVRAIGRLQSECFRNGMMNWGDSSGHYEVFTEFVHKTLKIESTFTKLVKKIIEADVSEIKQAGKRGSSVASGRKSRESAFGSNFLIASNVEKSLQRLGALTTLWCERHSDLVPYAV
jgi:hypothetical protein